jgi:hypothetical protein
MTTDCDLCSGNERKHTHSVHIRSVLLRCGLDHLGALLDKVLAARHHLGTRPCPHEHMQTRPYPGIPVISISRVVLWSESGSGMSTLHPVSICAHVSLPSPRQSNHDDDHQHSHATVSPTPVSRGSSSRRGR